MSILVIEDDEKINSFICKGLKESGHQVQSVHSGNEALKVLRDSVGIELAVVDLMLPGMDGLSLIKTLRSEGHTTPFLILSAKHSVEDRVTGLTNGADDYLVKPFSFSELLARIQVLLRRGRPAARSPTVLSKFGISMDLLSRKVTRNNFSVDLQAKEFSLLEFFLNHPERVVSKTMILEHVYGYDFDPQTNVVDVLVCRLRNKLEKDCEKRIIHTLRGIGYVLKED